VAAVGAQRHFAADRTGEPGRLRVHLERRPRIDRLGVRIRGDLGQSHEQFGGTGGDDEFVESDAEAIGQALTQCHRRVVGVVSGILRVGDHGVEDLGQRSEEVLVGGEFERLQPGDFAGRLARDIGREGLQHGPEARCR
jgi:hypothetical protein